MNVDIAALIVAIVAALGAVVASVFAGMSWHRAGEANKTAERATDSARRSADAAEASEQRQGVAEARALEVHAVRWDFRRLGEAVSFTNLGPDEAQNVTVTIWAEEERSVLLTQECMGVGDTLSRVLPAHWIYLDASARINWVSPLGKPMVEDGFSADGRLQVF